MTRRIFNSILFACLGVLMISMMLAMILMYAHYDAELLEELRTRTHYISVGVEQGGIAYLETLEGGDDRITLVGPDGTVLYDSHAEAATMENHAGRQEIAMAFATGTGEAERQSDTRAERTCYYALRLADGSVLRLAAAQSTVWALVASLLPVFLCAVVFLSVICAVIADSFSRSIMRPIDRMDPKAPPDAADTYEELAPLVKRLQSQSSRIANQMEELRRRQKEFAVVADNMSEGLLMIDAQAEILLCNASMAHFFRRPGGAVGQNVLLLNRSRPFRQAIGEVLEGRHTQVMLPLNGRMYELIANPVFDAQEKSAAKNAADEAGKTVLSGAVLLMVDVTEREERERLRREFTANVSHELKTPLTAIYGSSELLADGIVRAEDIPDFAQDIHAQAGRMIRLVEDILRLSQMEAGEIELHKEAVDLYGVALQVRNELAEAAHKAQVTLTVTGEAAVLQGVPAILHELVANLCDNAIKYNRPGGTVQVTVQNERPAEEAAYPVLTVSDTGIGIPKEHHTRVFERFYRVDKSHSRRIGGTGLGLSIVKHAVLLHGGRLSMESEPGVGTTITVRFDAAATNG